MGGLVRELRGQHRRHARDGAYPRDTAQRLGNPQYPWRANDLNDMHFLSCAADYADFVLAEAATTHDLRRAESRVPDGARICRSPAELVDAIEAER